MSTYDSGSVITCVAACIHVTGLTIRWQRRKPMAMFCVSIGQRLPSATLQYSADSSTISSSTPMPRSTGPVKNHHDRPHGIISSEQMSVPRCVRIPTSS